MRYESLDVWKKSFSLSLFVYQTFAALRDFGLKDQMCRSAVSVPSNIAEGMERAGNAEKRYFLNVAKGSCAEVRTQLMVGQEIEYMDAACAALWIEETRELSRMLTGLINRITE